MWRSIIFSDSFKRGKRIITKDLVLAFMKKILEQAKKLNLPQISEEKSFVGIEEMQEEMNAQNLFKTIFIPSISNKNIEYNKHLAGIMFAEYDPLLDNIVNQICIEEKKIFRSFPVKEHEVELIMNASKQEVKGDTLKIGDLVEILDGDYKGMVGKIEHLEDTFCSVNIQIFGVDQTVHLNTDQVKISEEF